MNFWQFANESPWCAFFLLALVVGMVCSIVRYACRARNISKNGWPPPHCDADGDFREEKDES